MAELSPNEAVCREYGSRAPYVTDHGLLHLVNAQAAAMGGGVSWAAAGETVIASSWVAGKHTDEAGDQHRPPKLVLPRRVTGGSLIAALRQPNVGFC